MFKAYDKGDKKDKKDKGGFHRNIATKDGNTELKGSDLEDAFKDFELNFEGNGKKLSVKASSRAELEAAVKAAQEFLAV